MKVTTKDDISKITDDYLRCYANNLIEHLLNEYIEVCTNGSIDSVGAIFIIDSLSELKNHSDFGLSATITAKRFEWINNIGNGYVDGCIVIDNNRAINLLGKQDLFTDYMEEVQNE